MRIISFLICSILFQSAIAQKNDPYTFYLDYEEKPASHNKAVYYVKVYKEKRSDTAWRWDMYNMRENFVHATGHSSDSKGEIRSGKYLSFHKQLKTRETGVYVNGKKQGEWIETDTAGMVIAKRNYQNGMLAGANYQWYGSNIIRDSTMLDQQGNGTGYGFYESGNMRYTGTFTSGSKDGKWDYYYDTPSKDKSMEVEFRSGKLEISTCYTRDGKLQKEDCYYEREAEFAAGKYAWQNYLTRKMINFNAEDFMGQTTEYQVMVSFVIAPSGKVVDVKVEKPGRILAIDVFAISVIEQSPPWDPAIQYNQKVNAYRRQPLTFVNNID